MMKKSLAYGALAFVFLTTTYVRVRADTPEESYKKGIAATRQENWDLAEKELISAAERGHLHAQVRLALMKVYYDNRAAVKWFRMAAEQGATGPALALADLLKDGGDEGEVLDLAEAEKWYLKAAGSAEILHRYEAALALGSFYEEGLRGGQDLVKANAWYSVAVTTGKGLNEKDYPDAIEGEKRTAARLTPEERARATRLAAEWRTLPKRDEKKADKP